MNAQHILVYAAGLCVSVHNSLSTLSYLDEWFIGLAHSKGWGRLAASGPSCRPPTAGRGLFIHNMNPDSDKRRKRMQLQYTGNIILLCIVDI